ncbi:hypothetical protein MEC_01330 [Bartonella alsatica IBS 382]|uniref:Uncharacterized protein n=1 Tax=Bartonella alsatica IBS 382 TaxID=1094551 RepID=J0YI97_9HYPH|nr:hypothetical protein MEC_01330 [Bartonella alsatica IBS 382]
MLQAWVRRAWIHIQLSDFKLAMLDLNHALELEPRNYIAFFALGVTMEATQPPQLAIKAYKKALEYYPQMQKLQKRLEVKQIALNEKNHPLSPSPPPKRLVQETALKSFYI